MEAKQNITAESKIGEPLASALEALEAHETIVAVCAMRMSSGAGALREFLDEIGVKYNMMPLIGVVAATGTKAQILAVAARDEIIRLSANGKVSMLGGN
jgi:hypothetical protein